MSAKRSGSRWAAACAAVAGLVMLAGCGAQADSATDNSGTSTGSSSTAANGWPACADIWKADSTIPNSYKGCTDGSTQVKADKKNCASGQVLITYADKFYGVLGGPVNPIPEGLEKSAKYRAAANACD